MEIWSKVFIICVGLLALANTEESMHIKAKKHENSAITSYIVLKKRSLNYGMST